MTDCSSDLLFSYAGNKLIFDPKSFACLQQDDNPCVPLYTAWLPCLSGTLFWDLTDPALCYYDYFNVNLLAKNQDDLSPECRYVLCSSVYDWKDEDVSGHTGLTRMIFIAKAQTPERLTGEIYLLAGMPEERDKKQEALSEDAALLHCLDNWTHTFQNQKNEFSEGEQQAFIDLFPRYPGENDNELIKTLTSFKHLKFERLAVEIEKNGITKIAYLGTKEKNSKKFVCKNTNKKALNTLSRFAFYYVKYTLHKHSHHDPGTDSLTRIHRYRKSKHDMAMAMIRDIKQGLVQLKRANSDAKQTTGIAVYGKSLVISCNVASYIDDKIASDQCNYFSNQANSIELLKNGHIPKAKERLSIFQQLLAIPFFFVTPYLLVTNWYLSTFKNVKKVSIDQAILNCVEKAQQLQWTPLSINRTICGMDSHGVDTIGLIFIVVIVLGLFGFQLDSYFRHKKTIFSTMYSGLRYRFYKKARSDIKNFSYIFMKIYLGHRHHINRLIFSESPKVFRDVLILWVASLFFATALVWGAMKLIY